MTAGRGRTRTRRRSSRSTRTEGNAFLLARRALWDDGVIDPADTRMVLALGIAAAHNAPPEPRRQGVYRM